MPSLDEIGSTLTKNAHTVHTLSAAVAKTEPHYEMLLASFTACQYAVMLNRIALFDSIEKRNKQLQLLINLCEFIQTQPLQSSSHIFVTIDPNTGEITRSFKK